MAVTETTSKLTARLKLNNGISPTTGQTLTVNVSFPSLAITATDQQIYALASALSPVLSKTTTAIEKVETSTLADNG